MRRDVDGNQKGVQSQAYREEKTTAKKGSTRKKSRAKKKIAKKTLGTCFVLMPFKDPFESYYREIVKPAIVNANLDVKRGDSLFTPTPIMGDVWQMIQDAKVLVAVLTGKNANVFYELGLAHAIGKPVVLISETMDDVPFDLQPLRVILYDKDDPAWGNKLRTFLTNALQETVDNPVDAVPPMFRRRVKSHAPEEESTLARVEALEKKFQLMMRSTTPPRRSQIDFRGDLRETVHNFEKLEEWVIKWYRRGVPAEYLEEAIRFSQLIPSEDKDRAIKIIRGGL